MSWQLLRSSFANLLGAALPALVALATIPFIVSRLGEVNYGVLTMVTAIVGYFALIDINVTSASVKYVAQYRATSQLSELYQVVTFGALVYLAIGVVGGVFIFFGADWLSRQLFNVPQSLAPLTQRTLELAAVEFLFGQMQVYLGSIPQSLQRFDVSAKIEAAFGVLVPLLTVLILWLGYGLYEVVLLRVVLSALNAVVAAVASWRLIPGFRPSWPTRTIARQLASFSAFSYLSGIAAACYAHADKLIIGALAGMASLTYYVIPSTLINRVLGLTFRLSSVVYPAASELESLRQFVQLKAIYFSATRYVFYLNACIVVLTCLFAEEILHYWMGEEFARQGALIMILTALAMLVDSMTNLPSMLADGMGHPRVTGLFSVFRAAVGLVATFVFATLWGIVGVAAGHLLVSVVMAVSFLVYVHRGTIPYRLGELMRKCYLMTFAALGASFAVFTAIKPPHALGLAATLAFGASIALAYALFGFYFILDTAHRRALLAAARGKLRSRFPGPPR
jgi:O-antigen/teichoic acid export membrane protein